ncbi:sensor histidine kinase [Streptomyces sp. NPDC058001]|uniref:sensor histidine kinase n=1 Tax=Streptomyces sp. NPDC058001 TaxID=3346300 RepID=UPI0036F13B84
MRAVRGAKGVGAMRAVREVRAVRGGVAPGGSGAGPGRWRPLRYRLRLRPRSATSPLATRPGPWPSAIEDDAPAPSLRIQLSALQALCRQVCGVRLAMIALGTPFALTGAADGHPRYFVLAAAVFSFMGSYAMLRDWERFGPRLLAHPTLLGVDLLLGSVLLLAASPASPLGYAAVCTPLLSGLLYGWRGAGVFTGIQIALLMSVYRAWEHRPGAGPSALLLAGFCVGAGIIGVTLRNLMFRFGAAGQALAEANARLAVRDAVESERARLAREMHDSVTKTLYGLALSADALAASADREDPAALRHRADLVARSARHAAAESGALLDGLRHHTEPGANGADPVDLLSELTAYAEDFTARTGLRTRVVRTGADRASLPGWAAREVLTIVGEALENTRRHAAATRVEIALSGTGARDMTLTLTDDGRGLPPDTTLPALRAKGHYGLIGMAERAGALGGTLTYGPGGGRDPGTAITLTLTPVPSKGARSHAG